MTEQHPQYDKMPKHYLMCFNEECELADSCLRRLAARNKMLNDEVVTAVNPAVNSGRQCKYYKENKLDPIAYGMVDSFHEVKADHISALRNTLINYFGRGSYYLRRNGLRPIPPEEQEYIAGVFRSFGYEVKFDRVEKETAWL